MEKEINNSILNLDWEDDCYGVISLDDDYEWYEIIWISLRQEWWIKHIILERIN